jgi:hypothetical protein
MLSICVTADWIAVEVAGSTPEVVDFYVYYNPSPG